jgi:ribosome production factor 2
MSTIGRFSRRTPKSAKSRRAVKKMEAQVFEHPKKALFLTGLNSSETVNDALVDLRALTQPHCKVLAKKNDFHAWTGTEHLEFLGFKNDCSLFCFGSSNKKRPNNLVMGRQYDFQVLDMIEFGILAADRLDMSRANGENCCSAGSRPMMVFEGSEWETEAAFERLKNFLLDFFAGSLETEINIAGVDRCIHVSLRSANGNDAVTAPSTDSRGTMPVKEKGNAVVCLRHYGVVQTKSSVSVLTNASNIKLIDVGPNFDLEIRRIAWAAPADFKRASRLPKQVLATLKHMHENVNADGLGNLRGQLHVGSQKLESISLRKFKSHREMRRSKGAKDASANLTANAAAAVTLEKRRAAKANGGAAAEAGSADVPAYQAPNAKARKVAADIRATDAMGDARMPKKRHRPGQGPAYDTMIGPDVDI